MHNFSASSIYLASEVVRGMLAHCDKQEQDANVTAQWIFHALEQVRQHCADASLPVSLNIVSITITIVSQEKPTTFRILNQQLHAMKEAIFAELRTMTFLRIDNQMSHLFEGKCLFGELVETKFPAASLDIDEAGKCLALGRPTAAVYHLIRVMEVGLKALARPIGIPYAPSWESYIRQIEAKINEKPKRKGIKWKRDEGFYRDVLGALQSIKIAWRNPTMHIVRHFNHDEAEDIFRAVRTFMKRLAERFSQVA